MVFVDKSRAKMLEDIAATRNSGMFELDPENMPSKFEIDPKYGILVPPKSFRESLGYFAEFPEINDLLNEVFLNSFLYGGHPVIMTKTIGSMGTHLMIDDGGEGFDWEEKVEKCRQRIAEGSDEKYWTHGGGGL